jgi:hypothetical protein
MEAIHATPAPEVFLVFPCPYFKVRNRFLKEWAGLALMSLTEAYQHTENARSYEISTNFAGLVGQYLHRAYKLMATELFGVPVEEASTLNFTMTDEQLATYDPSRYFTSTEMTDVVPTVQDIATEDDLRVLTAGIPATELVGLGPYPNAAAFEDEAGAAAAGGDTSTTPGGSFAPPPSA